MILFNTLQEIRELRQLWHSKDQTKNKLTLQAKELDHQMSKHQHDTKDATCRVGGASFAAANYH